MQGEGPWLGTSTLFVRLGGCDLRCRWCDSPHTWKPARECRIETERGAGAFRAVANPVPVEDALAAARALGAGSHRFASLTGGEPLLQPDAVAALAEGLRAMGPAVHLETHGLHADALGAVLPHVDVVSMDWKLASEVRRESEPKGAEPAPFHEAHTAFLARARTAPALLVKLVVTGSSTDAELEEAFERVAKGAPDATLVLQPVTPFGPVRERPSATRILALARKAEAHLRDVRVIPQTHPIYGAP